MESDQVATRGVLVVFWHVSKIIQQKLLEDGICRATAFVNKKTWAGDKKILEVDSSQCGVIRVTDLREQVNAREKRFKVRVNWKDKR